MKLVLLAVALVFLVGCTTGFLPVTHPEHSIYISDVQALVSIEVKTEDLGVSW